MCWLVNKQDECIKFGHLFNIEAVEAGAGERSGGFPHRTRSPLANARPDKNRTNKLFQIIILNGSEREDDPDACLEHIQPLAQHARKEVVAKIDLRSNGTRQLELHATAVVDGELGSR